MADYSNSFNRPQRIIDAAREATAELRGMRILRAEHNERGWRLKYITLSEEVPVRSLESRISRAVGEAVSMIDLHYDFDTTARLLYA